MKIEEEEEGLINRIKKDRCEKSLKLLSDRHSGIFIAISKRYFRKLESYGIFPREIVAEKELVVYRSVLSYDPSKNTKYSTWLANCVRYHCLNTINANKKYIKQQELSQALLDRQSTEDYKAPTDDSIREYALGLLGRVKDKRIKEIFNLRYFSESDKLTWHNIGQSMDISTQTVINLHQKGIKMLLAKMSNKKIEDLV